MSVVSQEDFITLCEQFNYDSQSVYEEIKKLYPNYDTRPGRIATRLENYRKRGLLPLASGNRVSVGEILKGTSTLFDEFGSIKQQWVKTDVPKQSQIEALNEAISNIIANVPAAPTSTPPTHITNEDTLSVYNIGDAHLGLYSWEDESGTRVTLHSAVQDLTKAMQLLVQQSTPSKEAFIVDLGDYFHSDSNLNRTAKSGNPLDVDGRYGEILEVGLRLATILIDMALEKHEIVHWRSLVGNHNEHSAIMINAYVRAWYRNDPRVIVHDNQNVLYYHQFGKNLIGFTHGHTVKADKLGEIMAVDCETIWSETKFRYWYTGHVHHQSVKEYPSCVVETFRTLIGKDTWHSHAGYRSGRDMRCITLHKEYGEISRNTVNIHQL